MAIITLTRQSGSMGDEIGMLIARRLGYTFYSRKEIEQRIIEKGFTKEELKKYDERKPNFFDRFSKLRDKYLNCLSMVILEMQIYYHPLHSSFCVTCRITSPYVLFPHRKNAWNTSNRW